MRSDKFAKIKIRDILIPKERKITKTTKQIKQLSESIRTYGRLEPIGVYKFNHWKYKLVYGNSRITALNLLKHDEIYAKIKEDPTKHSEISYAENMFRKSYTLEEIANVVANRLKIKLLQEDGLFKKATLKDVAKTMGKSPTYITYYKSYIYAPKELKMVYKINKITNVYLVYEINKLYKKQITESKKMN